MIIAKDARFHDTWERLQRRMGDLLTTSYSEINEKKEFLKAVDRVENALVDLYMMGIEKI
jgi:hypothetical protein